MTISHSLYQLLFGPLELLFEYIYGISYNIIGNVGAAIIPLSLCMNFLTLPFYNRADAIQRVERNRENRMTPGIEHIKKVFKADERFMMLQAYYRINKYKPIYALRSSLPLLLEIPFFIAAYHFLSNLPDLYGTQFGIINNLGMPDGLLLLGGMRINVLPIFMTMINILSSMVYAKELSWKDKTQLYGISFVFFILLYNSPSGLVFYWTLNQIFSLCKNLVYSVKNRRFVVSAVMSAMGVIILAYALVIYRVHDLNQLLIILIGLVCQVPTVRNLIRKGEHNVTTEVIEKPTTTVFVLGCIFMAFLTGLLIPSSVVRSSPAEFVVIAEYQTPLIYVVSALLLSVGTFILWFGLFYYLQNNNRGKRIMRAVLWVISIFALVNYMLFGKDLGNLSAELQYDREFALSAKDLLINTEALILICAAALIIWIKNRSIIRAAYSIMIVAVLSMSMYNISGIISQIPQIKALVKRENGEKATL